MNIIIQINNETTENITPKVYDLGQITTNLQDLLDESQLFIDSFRPIILRITDLDDVVSNYLLILKNYEGNSIYGLGKDITVNDLVLLGGSSGGGGSQTWAQTLANDRTTGGYSPLIADGDAIVLDNGSLIHKGTFDESTGGAGGIELVCTAGFPLKWEGGALYSKESDGETNRPLFVKTPLDVSGYTKIGGYLEVKQGVNDGIGKYSLLNTTDSSLFFRGRIGSDYDDWGQSILTVNPEQGFESYIENNDGTIKSRIKQKQQYIENRVVNDTDLKRTVINQDENSVDIVTTSDVENYQSTFSTSPNSLFNQVSADDSGFIQSEVLNTITNQSTSAVQTAIDFAFIGGNVGINTSEPIHKLDLAGNLRVKNNDATLPSIFIDGVVDAYFGLDSTDGTVSLNLHSGTDEPQIFKLEILDKLNSSQSLGIIGRLNESNRYIKIGNIADDANGNNLIVDELASTTYYDNIEHNGKFGINTNNPTVALDVFGDINVLNANNRGIYTSDNQFTLGYRNGLDFEGLNVNLNVGAVPIVTVGSGNFVGNNTKIIVDDQAKTITSNSDISVDITSPQTNVNGKLSIIGDATSFAQKTTAEINALVGMVEGDTYYNTDLHTICFYNGTSWKVVSATNI